MPRCPFNHEDVKQSEAWHTLRFVGVQGDDVEVLELRNCVCGSTLAKLVEDKPHPLDAYPIPPDVFRAAGVI